MLPKPLVTLLERHTLMLEHNLLDRMLEKLPMLREELVPASEVNLQGSCRTVADARMKRQDP
jgi:hypothetical protein